MTKQRRSWAAAIATAVAALAGFGGLSHAAKPPAVASWSSQLEVVDVDTPVYGVQADGGSNNEVSITWIEGSLGVVPDRAGATAARGGIPMAARVSLAGAPEVESVERVPLPGRVFDLRGGTTSTGELILTALLARDGALVTISRSSEGLWSEPQTLVRKITGHASAFGPDGTGAAVWIRSGRYWGSVRNPGGGFGKPTPLGSASRAVGTLEVAASSHGQAALLLRQECSLSDRTRRFPALISFASPGGTRSLTKPQPVPGSKCDTSPADLTVDRRGRATATFSGRLGANPIRIARRMRPGRIHKARTVERKAGFASIVGNDRGRGLAIWTKGEGRAKSVRALVNPSRPDGSPHRISGRPAGGLLDLAVNERGDLGAVWQALDSLELRAAVGSSKTGLGEASTVAPAPGRLALASPEIAVTERGEITVVWSRAEPNDDFGIFLSVAARP